MTFCLTAASDANIPFEYVSQLAKIQRERQLKYKHFGRVAGNDVDSALGKCIFLSSDLIPGKIGYWPHMLTSRGITIRCDLRSDSYHLVPKRAFTSLTFSDNLAGGDVPDLRVKFSNMRLTTTEVVPSIEFQRALLDLQMAKGYFAFPTYSVQGQQVDIKSANLSQPIDAAGS